MKHFAILFLLVTSSFPCATAGSLSGSGVFVTLAMPEAKTVAVTMSMPADFVSVPLHVISDQKNAGDAYRESRQVVELIAEKAKENGRFRTVKSVVSLSKPASKFGISSGFSSHPAATAQLYLLVPFSKEYDNVFEAGAAATQFVEALRLPGKARCQIGQLQLAVDNPEQYRAKLISQLAQEVHDMRRAIWSGGSVKVEGLESSVLVRQVDDRNVELFLDYSLSLTTTEK
jgi:hypothetical protein